MFGLAKRERGQPLVGGKTELLLFAVKYQLTVGYRECKAIFYIKRACQS